MTDVDLVKSKIDIVDFISEHVQLKKAGRNFKALCPFHSEKTPSFVVSPERQSWHCFGACNMGGDVISFLEKWENLEFIEALKILAQRGGVTLSSYTPTETSKVKEKLYEINHLASEFFHFLLTGHKLGARAREYLKSRNIKDEIVKTFSLGYAPDSWENLLRFLTKKGYTTADIFTAGLLVKGEQGGYYDRFRGRLIFTLKDHRGNIVGFSGRKLPASPKGVPPQEEKEAKYVNTPETPIYIKGNTLYGLDVTRESIKKEKDAIVVEGEFDLLSSFQSGVTNVVAIKGSALTEGQTLLLKRYTENIELALDSDFAGSEAARRGIEIAENVGLIVRVVQLPFGKDPAECIDKDPFLWKKSIKKTVPVYDFIIENAFKKYGNEGATGKKKVGREVIPFIAKIENPIITSHYVRLLAKKLEVTEEAIELAIRQFQKKKEVEVERPPELPSKVLRGTLLEEYLLSLIIQSEDAASTLTRVMKVLQPDDFNEPAVKKIVELLLAYFKTHKKFRVKDFNKFLSAEIETTFDRTYLADINNILSQSDIYSKELNRCCKEIKKLSLRRNINNLSTKIRKLEEEKDEKGAALLHREIRELLLKIGEIDKST
jgi:DNA primase